jgi:peptidoglycan/xylan/chitin deacetylase (PgdA/CDA1 family)
MRSPVDARDGSLVPLELGPDMSASTNLAILVYHSVAPGTNRPVQPYTIERARFEEHLDALKEEAFELVRFRDVPAALRQGRRAVAITIDDGFADTASEAAPALLDRGLVGTLFVPSGFVGASARWLSSSSPKPLLSWSEIVDLSSAGFEIGSHGRHHLAAHVTPVHQFAADAARSKLELEYHLDSAVESFAYPYGRETASARRAVRTAGFAQAATVADIPATTRNDRLALPRLDVAGGTTAEELMAMIDRHPSLVSRGRGYAKRQTQLASRLWVSRGRRTPRKVLAAVR